MISSHILAALEGEIQRANSAHGAQYRPVAEWLLIAEGELLEAKQAWLKHNGDAEALRELIQVAATVLRCLEQHGVADRLEGEQEMLF